MRWYLGVRTLPTPPAAASPSVIIHAKRACDARQAAEQAAEAPHEAPAEERRPRRRLKRKKHINSAAKAETPTDEAEKTTEPAAKIIDPKAIDLKSLSKAEFDELINEIRAFLGPANAEVFNRILNKNVAFKKSAISAVHPKNSGKH